MTVGILRVMIFAQIERDIFRSVKQTNTFPPAPRDRGRILDLVSYVQPGPASTIARPDGGYGISAPRRGWADVFQRPPESMAEGNNTRAAPAARARGGRPF